MVGPIVKPKFITEEPVWMKGLAGDSLFNARNMKQLFNINVNTTKGIMRCIDKGIIPPPSLTLPMRKEFSRNMNGTYKQGKLQWSVADLRKFFKANKESNNENI